VNPSRMNQQPATRSGTNLPQLADLNEAVVLGWIRRSEAGLSRVELTEATGLSAQAVSNICQRLLDAGMIKEAGKTTTGTGKPRTLLTLDATGAYAIGVHLDPAIVTIVLLDLLGSVVARTSFITEAADLPDELLARIGEAITRLIDDSGVDRTRVAGVGIASPGPIDANTGTVLDPPLLTEWHNVPVRDRISAATGLPALLDKDVIAAVVAERWAGRAGHSRNAAFIYLGAGIGAGVILEDVVVRGASGNAGDIGMFEVAGEDGAGTVDLGDMANPVAVIARAVQAGIFATNPGKANPLGVDERFTELCRLADGGDERAERILNDAAERIGGAVSRIANLLDIDTVVFGGPTWSRLGDRYLDVVAAIIREGSITRRIHPIDVVGTGLGEDVGAIGAACLVLDETAS
jgi:predicted NBD/HSP70 family sugar kinase